jgi:hypothetical protein
MVGRKMEAESRKRAGIEGTFTTKRFGLDGQAVRNDRRCGKTRKQRTEGSRKLEAIQLRDKNRESWARKKNFQPVDERLKRQEPEECAKVQ